MEGGGSKIKFDELHFEGKCDDYLNFTKFFYSNLPSLKKNIKIIETGPKHSKKQIFDVWGWMVCWLSVIIRLTRIS